MIAPSPSRDVLDRWRKETARTLDEAPVDLIEEVALHLAARWEEARTEGRSVADADRAAFAELDRWRARGRGTGGDRLARHWTDLGLELRRAGRAMLHRPAFAAAMTLLVTVAIAAAGAATSVVYGLLWRPLRYPDSARLAVVWQVERGVDGQVSYPDYQDLMASGVADAGTAIASGTGSLRVDDRIERVNLVEVEPQGLAMLGARPVLGRLLGPGDRGMINVLISHRLWTTQLGADPDVVGRVLWLSGRNLTVVGVLAPGFDFELPVLGAFRLEHEDLWTIFDPTEEPASRRSASTYEVLLRVRDRVALPSVQETMDAVAARLATEHPDTNANRGFRTAWLRDEIVRDYRRPVMLSALAAVIAFLIALTNVVTLASVQLSDRQQELAVRRALGASAFRIRRQLVAESLMVTAAGTAAGVILARLIVSRLIASDAAHLPRIDAIRFDAPVWLVTAALGLAIVTALACLPCCRAVEASALRTGSRTAPGTARSRRWLVAAELALAMTLTASGALLGLSLARLVGQDPGYTTDGVVTLRVSAYAAGHPGNADVTRFFASVLDGIKAMPGVTAAGLGSNLPLSGHFNGTSVVAEGQPATSSTPLTAQWQYVSPGYLRSLGIALRDGRMFTAADADRDGHVTIVNETLARRLFGDRPAVGHRLAIGGDTADLHEIVGVVADTRNASLAEAPAPRVYDLFGQHWGRTAYLVARTTGPAPASFIAPMRRAVASLDPDAPVFEIASLADLVDRSVAPALLSATIASGLATAALFLALAGVYATAAVSVATRQREMGVRTALGATRGRIIALVLRESTGTTAAGILTGTAGAFLAARVMSTQLFGSRGLDTSLGLPLLAVTMAAAALVATLPAAIRAANSDPLSTMRGE
jgi:putative ABC transport system permease protein